MSSSQRDKGNRGEREVVKLLKKWGFPDATRNYLDKIRPEGVDVEAGNLDIQVKRRAKSVPMKYLYEIQRTGGYPILFSRVDYGEWLVTMTAEQFLELINDPALAWKE